MPNGRSGNQVAVPFDMDRIKQIGENLLKLRDELGEIFPERGDLINQIIFALMTREHVLVTGTYGTGKTDLLETLCECIENIELFSLDFTQATTESHLFGMPSPKEMRDTGKIVYDRSTGMLDADVAHFGEFLDATPQVLRSLLGVIHGRVFKRGRQIESAALLTAVADTNVDPVEAVKKDKRLGPVIDRFVFRCTVEYLREEVSRIQMYTKYLNGSTPSVRLTRDDIRYISKMVVSSNQIRDLFLIEVYDRVIQAYRAEASRLGFPVVSDRTACKLLQLVEAEAILHGREEVVVEDILAIRWGLCQGGNTEQQEAFDRVVQPIIEQAKTQHPQSVDAVQQKLLEKLDQSIPAPLDASATETQLVTRLRELNALRYEVADVQPTVDSTTRLRQAILSRIDSEKTHVNTLIEGGTV